MNYKRGTRNRKNNKSPDKTWGTYNREIGALFHSKMLFCF